MMNPELLSFPEDLRQYDHPLVGRYSSKEMSLIWSPAKKFSTWRRLWTALAQAEMELGLNITTDQVEEMRRNIYNIDFDAAEEMEKKLRHDVMAHIHVFGQLCPSAKPIIHLGATSCFVGDNTDIIQMKEGLLVIQDKLYGLMRSLADFAMQHRSLATLGFTHLQAAQLTTVGKRAALWLQDFWLDAVELDRRISSLPLRGVKGTTGTQASFLELFEGDHDKVVALNKRVCELMGFSTQRRVLQNNDDTTAGRLDIDVQCIPLSGQTYTRKIDVTVLSILAGIGESAYKMACDVRILAHMKEIEEPFDEGSQVGSSAMPYKRNPMRCERVCSLSRYVMALPAPSAQTHACQWFERTLDDSAIRRIILPEGFLATDVILSLLNNITNGLIVLPLVIKSHVEAEISFMATENIMMECVKHGGNRQDLHEAIRLHSISAGHRVKYEGLSNDLMERLKADPLFASVCVPSRDGSGRFAIDEMTNPQLFIGRAPEQVVEFCRDYIEPMLASVQVGNHGDEVNI